MQARTEAAAQRRLDHSAEGRDSATLRVLLLVETLGVGGSEQSLVYLLPALRTESIVCDVGVLWGPYDLEPALREVGVVVHRIDAPHRWDLLRSAWKLASLIERERYDVIHSKLFFPGLSNALSRLRNQRAGRVVSFHNLAYDRDRRPQTRARKLIDRVILPRSIDRFAALSRAVADSYSRAIGVRNVTVVPNAVPTETMRPLDREERDRIRASMNLPVDVPLLTMPARLVRDKAHDVFLRALERLHDRGLDHHVAIAGKGPLRGDIEATLARAKYRDRVTTFLDGLAPAEARALSGASDIVVVPSRLEGFGLAPAEAMSMGVPVVASGVGGLLDLIEHGDSGYLVRPEDDAALADALAKLLEDPALRSALGRGGRARVQNRFDVKPVAQLWRSIYQDVSAIRSPPRPV